jgi:hypothetical protein
VNATSLGTLISALAAVLFVVLALATFRARRTGQEAKDLREARATANAGMRYAYQIQNMAAIKGWDLPPMPKEMTAEYLIGKSESGGGNVELAQLAQLAQGLIPDQTGHAEGAKP